MAGGAPSGGASWNPSFDLDTVHTIAPIPNNTKKKSKLFIFLVSVRKIATSDS